MCHHTQSAEFVADEKTDPMREGLILLSLQMCSQQGPKCTICVDNASALRSLVNDTRLERHNIQLELGREKYKNKCWREI